MVDRAALQDHFAAEQADFVALAQTLTADQWATPSLCRGWTVRDVVVHTAWHIHRDSAELRRSLLRALLSGTKRATAYQMARDGARANDDLVDWLSLPGQCNQVYLGELLIHQQDVRRPLGMTRTVPAERSAIILDLCLTRFGSTTLVPVSRKLSKGLHLVATDIEWEAGHGADAKGPAEAILMAVNGRADAIEELSGPGAQLLAVRLGSKHPSSAE
jgi:uncharacterized protein (TIGR03083 family)